MWTVFLMYNWHFYLELRVLKCSDLYQEDFTGLPGVPFKAELSYIQYNPAANLWRKTLIGA